MLNKLLKTLTVSVFFLISGISFSQSVVFGNIIKENPSDTIDGKLVVYKQIDDSTYLFKEKRFRNQSMVSLDIGEYIFAYYFANNSFVEKVSIKDEESVVIMNILENPMTLSEFNFSNVIYLSSEMVDLAVQKRRYIYMDFDF